MKLLWCLMLARASTLVRDSQVHRIATNAALMLARTVGVHPGDVGVGDREEVGVVRIEEVGHAGPVALARQLERALDDVALCLEPDAEAAVMHAVSIGHLGGGL